MSLPLFTPTFYACVAILFAAIYVNREGSPDFDATSLMQHKITVEMQPSRLNITSQSQEACGDILNHRASFASTSETLHHKAWHHLFSGRAVPAHPFPSWGWEEVKIKQAIICCVVLFIGAVICSAGGIGGGGIYVTVLMVAGQLTPHDAVPLSKAVVFFGSLSSLFLNIKKTLAMQEGGNKATLIDYNVCRLVVPCSLLGTLIGVMVNSLIASWLIVAMLAGILIVMTYMSFQKFTQQYMAESMLEEEHNDADNPQDNNPQDPIKRQSTRAAAAELDEQRAEGHIRGILLSGEGWGAFFLLLFTIICGVFRQHSMNCRSLLSDGMGPGLDSCTRPIISIFLGGSLCTWMSDSTLKQVLPIVAIVVPAAFCLAIASAYSATLMKSEGWQPREVCAYSVMALFTGCFAGLVGIGGGLVFSPFMLWMGLAPSVAVATSSTLVIFTSSSTTMQYLFTDRITISLAIIYGVCSSLASYVGTSAVHALQEKFNARPSYITGVVCVGVAGSVVLSVYKLLTIGMPAH